MSTLADKSSPSKTFRRAYRPTSALAKSVHFDGELMHVSLNDGRVVSAPILWFKLLREAAPQQRDHCEIDGGGVSVHWPDIDEDISVAGLLDGADWQST